MTKPPILGRILFLLAKMIGLLPIVLLRALGSFAGWLAYHSNSRETHVARCNMQLIYPNDSAHSNEQKVRAILRSAGQTLFETLAIWSRPRPRALQLIGQIHGIRHLETALSKGKGVLIAAPHYGNWELLLKFLSERAPFSLVYRVPKKTYGDYFLHLARGGPNVSLVPAEATAMRPLLRALQHGETVGITPDQQPKMGGGEFAPFFGKQALTLSLIAKLSKRSGAPVIFAYTERTARGFDVYFEAETLELQDDNLLNALSIMNQHVQRIAERDFRQYQWTYKRFSIQADPSMKKPYK
jgi:Kdo2-lipid IVA lauroyltransferase/acyltransferase